MQTNKKKGKNIIGIIQSFLILILVVLIIFMMIQISRLQGTARVINYAGLVRGATQREIKLEITGNQNDELIKYLDDILLGLRYQDGHYDLVKLNDEEYQEKLQIQSDYWDKLKTEIEAVRNKGYENTDIVNMSEIYFTMADETVSAAESYSEKIAVKIRTIELLSALDMLSLVILVIMQTLKAMQNRLLEQKAFVDAHTALVLDLCFAVLAFIVIETLHTPISSLFLGKDGTALAYQVSGDYMKWLGYFFIFMGIKMATDGVLRGLGIMRPFLIANMVNLAIRLSVALIFAPRYGIAFVWLAVPAGWLANFLISYGALRKSWPVDEGVSFR